MERMNGVLAIGVMFVFAGLMGFAIPDYTGGLPQTAAKAGDPPPSDDPPVHIPMPLSGSLLAAGLAMVGISLRQKR